MATSDDPTLVAALEASVGHPGDKWYALKQRVQDEAIKDFSAVQTEWLDLQWTLDAYRTAGLVPRGMGTASVTPGKRLAAIYRSKGNWFASLVAILLSNRTSQKLASRSAVEGFSQNHQIDVAWPDRSKKPIEDPLICLETKVTGAPPYDGTKARGAMSDWTNRRKELKFAATDLKLYRRGSETVIDHWDVWRTNGMPKCYFLWGARLRPEDSVPAMTRQVQALVNTYLDGAGICAWKINKTNTGYEPVPVKDPSSRVLTIDDVLRRIASEINLIAPPGKQPPPPEKPAVRAVDPSTLFDQERPAVAD